MPTSINPIWLKQLEACWQGSDLPSAFESVRPEAWSTSEVSVAVEALFKDLRSSGKQKQLTEAALLIWHDRLDDAHVIAQDLNDKTGAYLHSIIHRREPDFSNARYWLHRIGAHPSWARFRASLKSLGGAAPDETILLTIERDGTFNAESLLQKAEAIRKSNSDTTILRKLQAAELLAILSELAEPGT